MAAWVEVRHPFLLEGVTPEKAWQWIADTASLNRISFIPAYASMERIEARYGDFRFRVRTGLPLRMEWIEEPFDFVRPRRHRVHRVYPKGPIKEMDGGADLEPHANGTLATFVIRFLPRFPGTSAVLRLAALTGFKRAAKRIAREVKEHLANGAAVMAPPVSGLVAGGEERLAAALTRMRTARAPRVDVIEKLVRESPDVDLLRLRPFEIADRLGLPRLELLRASLHAARAGLFDLQWDVMCPHCRHPIARGTKLDAVAAEGVCTACELSVSADFDTAVEVTFKVNPGIRPNEVGTFCMGSPAARRTTLAQTVVAGGATKKLTVSLAPGDYVLSRADVLPAVSIQAGTGEASSVDLVIEPAGPRIAAGGDHVRVRAGEVELSIASRLDAPSRVILQQANLSGDAASAAMVTSLQEFRELFSSEVLAPGVQMAIASITLLFTDLKGSTALYERFGDPKVFPRVREHFDELTEAVRGEGGAVVKTIGDAVMAVFPTPAAGVRAALGMQRRIEALNRRNAESGVPALVVKVGLHSGACLAMTANEKLDYFGNTVNTAARIEGQSAGGDVVVTDAVAKDPEVSSLLREQAGLKITPFQAALKGLTGSAQLVRIELPREGAAAARAAG